MSAKKAIIFDFDGVIVDSFKVGVEIAQIYDPSITADEYSEMFHGNIYAAWDKRFPNYNEEPSEKKVDFINEYIARIEKTKLQPGIRELLKTLIDRNLKLSIVSSNDSPSLTHYLEKEGLLDYFPNIYGGEIEYSKTKKLEMAINDANVQKSEAVFITDTLGDIRESGEAGIECIAVTWGFHDEKTLKNGHPWKMVTSPQEIENLLTN